jgi:protein tyrosine phosphatase (PTP) superfamily phosphohydrolase (DUF442 family)
MKKNNLAIIAVLLVVVFGTGIYFIGVKPVKAPRTEKGVQTITSSLPSAKTVPQSSDSQLKNTLPVLDAVIKFIGPREGIPENAPKDYGLWSFAMPVQGVLSRSGQPLFSGFKWMKENGWKSVVDLRVDGERGEVGDDRKIPGFNGLGLNFLSLPLVDGIPPTDEQAKQFIAFVINPINQPAHVHCRGGIGRAGTMVVLYRYAVQGWPMDKAIEESRAFQGGISDLQKKWLEKWAAKYKPGEYKF